MSTGLRHPLMDAQLGTVVSAAELREYARLMLGTPWGLDGSFALSLLAEEWVLVLTPVGVWTHAVEHTAPHPEHVERWLSWQAERELPPIIGQLRLGRVLDGKHRTAAARATGAESIRAWVPVNDTKEMR